MPDLRRNPLTGQWVIVAENRLGRPRDVDVQHVIRDGTECPFCEGHEERTPGEVLAARDSGTQPNTPGWRVRVVPNKFPALVEKPTSEMDAALSAHPDRTSSTVDTLAGYGRQEIIIESARHLVSVAQLSDAEFAEVLEIYRQRLSALHVMQLFREVLLFKNAGPAAGASVAHVHSQLIATQLPQPISQFDRAAAFQKYFDRFGKCLLCEMARQEAAGNRVVAQSAQFLAFCPYASRFDYETWIVPRDHQGQYHQLDPKSLPQLAGLFRAILARLEQILKHAAYNYVIHTAPFDGPGTDHYHWHIEILPRSSGLAGLELGMGCYLNTVRPELAAAALRNE